VETRALVPADGRRLGTPEDGTSHKRFLRASRDHRAAVGKPLPGETVPAMRQFDLERSADRALLAEYVLRRAYLSDSKDGQETEELPAVREAGHVVEFGALAGPA